MDHRLHLYAHSELHVGKQPAASGHPDTCLVIPLRQGPVAVSHRCLPPSLCPTQARKLVFTTVDRAISYYETNRGSYELSGRVYASGGMGVPQTLTLVSNEAGGWG